MRKVQQHDNFNISNMISVVIWLYLNVSTLVQYQDWKHGFELANQCFAHRHWTSFLLKQLFINALNKVLDSQRLTRLSSHQTVQIETDGKCSNFGCWNALHSKCMVKPLVVQGWCIPFIEELVQPNQHTSPIRGCRYDLQCKNFMARPNVWRGLCQTWSLPKLDHKYVYIYIHIFVYYKNECIYKWKTLSYAHVFVCMNSVKTNVIIPQRT